jgi:hypothetical protein
MPSRGSAQFLLLFLRSRAKLGRTMGTIAGALIVAALLQAGGEFPFLTKTGLAQALRQSAWQHALAGVPQATPLPWASATPAAGTEVPRLGVSAAMLKEDGSATTKPVATGDRHTPRAKLSEVGVGDRITVTMPDGSSRDYRVTGRKVIDPHLAESETGASDIDATLVTCMPLDPLLASSLSLVLQATKVDPPVEPEPDPEQKL